MYTSLLDVRILCSIFSLSIALIVQPASASEMIGFVNVGGGPQGHSGQSHRSLGIDVNFFQYQRSVRQELSIGAGYTYINSNGAGNSDLHAFSVYPQLRLSPVDTSKFKKFLPQRAEPYFLVRFLGPSYISENSLGKRQQANHFSFQASVGVGFKIPGRSGKDAHFTLSWKHFSNANLFDDNDGIDVPLVLSIGKAL